MESPRTDDRRQAAPAANRRRVLTMAGGLVVAGTAASWAISRSAAEAATGRRSVAKAATTGQAVAQGRKPGTVLWRALTSSSAPYPVAAANGVVAILSGDNPNALSGDDNSKVVGYDSATGARRWITTIFGGVLLQAQGGMVIVTGWDGPFRMLGLDAAAGKQVWSGSCNNDDPQMALAYGLCVVPAASKSAAVTAYDVRTGAHAWTFAFPGGGHAQPVYIAAGGGAFYISDTSSRVWRVSKGGTGLAHFTVSGPYPFPIAVTNGVLCGFSGSPTTSNQGLYALHASTGQELWSISPYGVNYAMAVNDGSLYVSGGTDSNTSVLMAMDASTGKVGWKHEWPTNTLASSPLAYAQGTVLVGIGQALCALDAATGDKQWQVKLDGQVAQLAVGEAVAYVSTGLQTGAGLYAIQL